MSEGSIAGNGNTASKANHQKSKAKSLFSNKLILLSLGFILGSLSFWFTDRVLNTHQDREGRFYRGHQSNLTDISDSDPWFKSNEQTTDPFEELSRLKTQMQSLFNDSSLGHTLAFQDLFAYGGSNLSSLGELQQREDNDYVYYEIPLRGQDPKHFKVEVQDGQVSISGQVENTNEQSGSIQSFSSSFHRSFPVPADVQADAFRMEHEKDRIILKFPKLKTSQVDV